ncbi:hypothetical protein [Pantoea sp. JZ2]|uniref:hypothetical protein n=1 Tax=Pantoea sp. JZ2 TaxID=2654189 RepID=UPI003A5CBB4F
MMTFAYPWNAPRLAIASPYPTYDQQQHRDRLIAAWLHGQKTLNAQARMVQLDVRRRMALLEKQQGTARANAYLAKTFVERTLPRVESVNQRYQLHAMRPGIVAQLSRTLSCPQGAARAAGTLWELMKRFNRLPDMSVLMLIYSRAILPALFMQNWCSCMPASVRGRITVMSITLHNRGYHHP